jgi:hypothetical protein
MERRLDRLETLWQADQSAVSGASYSIEWMLKWPRLGLRDEEPTPDPEAVAARIREQHALDDAGMTRALEVALTRLGMSRDEVRPLAAFGLAALLQAAEEAA